MRKEGFVSVILNVILLSIITIGVISFFIYQKIWMGFIFIGLGILHLLVLKLLGTQIKIIWPDIIFGIIDNGFLAVGALIGADFAGVLGAVVGASAGNAITDGLAGIFEGKTAEYMRKYKIKENRTALNVSLGKMAGCFFGAGFVLIIAWTIFSL